MVQLVVFINLFFVPLLPLYIIYRKKQKSLEPSLDLLFHFGIVAACNVPCTKVFVFLIRKIAGIDISIDSGYYTVAAFLPTVLAIMAYELYQAYLRWKEENGPIRFSVKERLKLSLPVNLFFAFTVLVFVPYDTFFSNQSDFAFSFSDFWWIMASFGFMIFVGMMFILMVVPPKVFVLIESLLFSLTLLFYIQRMFLNFYVTSIVTDKLNTGEHPIWRFVNLLIWVGVISAVLFLFCIKIDFWKNVLCFVSAGLILVQGVAMTSLLITEDLSGAEHLTTEGLYEVASDNNIVVFILDYYNFTFYDAVKEVDPDFYDRLEGFTYFDNTASVYSRSYPANTYLLTGLELDEYYIQPAADCIDKAFSESTFIPDLKELGFEIGVYTKEDYVGKTGGDLIDNYSNEAHKLSYSGTLAGMMRCSLYFEMPYLLKPFFWTYDINSMATEGNQYVADDAKFYTELCEKKLTVSNAECAYKYIHLDGAHPPYTLDENSERVPSGVNDIQQWMGCMNIVYEYLDQMKMLGKYDSATIIITADHGIMAGTGDLTSAVAPIMFVKPAYAPASNLTISHAPVSHTDIFPTIIEAAGGDCNAYGKSIFSINENENRPRIFHYAQMTDWLDDNVVDYEITENVRDFENWRVKSTQKILASLYGVIK